ncbi:MAG TPA: KUP/HAK/KT family potassium transporter [Polyangiales bacterium]
MSESSGTASDPEASSHAEEGIRASAATIIARTAPESADQTPEEGQAHGSLAALTLAAIGVVYGDIGTSPLYALKECLSPHYGIAATRDNVLGLLSLMTWSLTMVVTVKYLVFITRATNRGEGGILALLALCPERLRVARPGRITLVTGLVVFGAALLYGDGMITPAISVLSAVEGLSLVTDTFDRWVVPIACLILLGLFSLQRTGTARVGVLFGPIMVLWFLVLSGLGVYHVAHNPSVLLGLSPHYAVLFLAQHGFMGFAVLGSVVLCVTGGEALYADMGHFGLPPIRRAWYALVMPSLLLAYFGQGANVLAHPEAAENPFYTLVPAGGPMLALIVLATMAAVIASQALISGAFSLTHQAVQLGLFPRITVKHTSSETEGQIYLPEINWFLAVSCVALVLHFGSSTGLAAAYGIAVCGTMAITSVMFALVAGERWNWSPWAQLGALFLFLLFDLGFLGSNLLKFSHGGYVPIFVAAAISVLMITWTVGRSNLGEYYKKRAQSWAIFTKRLSDEHILRPDAVGVFMASDAFGVPAMVLHQAERIRAVPSRALLVTVRFERVPHVSARERLAEVTDLGHGFHRVVARYGFMQSPEVPPVIDEVARRLKLSSEAREVTYYLGRESLVAGTGGKMGRVSEGIFRLLVRNALPATAYFRLPPEQVVEIGLQIDL